MNSVAYLADVVTLRSDKLIGSRALREKIRSDSPVLLILAAGKGTRFGSSPKCIAPVLEKPLSRHSLDAFERVVPDSAKLAVIGYRHEEVAEALGDENLYVVSENPTGGTAWAVFEAFSLSELLEKNPILVISMGDRVVPAEIFERLLAIHKGEAADGAAAWADGAPAGAADHLGEADLTLLTARYDAARLLGKGRIVRDEERRIIRIVEERDIRSLSDGVPATEPTDETGVNLGETILRSALSASVDDSDRRLVKNAFLSLSEGNCPLYVIRAATLFGLLKTLANNNAQGQYYLTDIVERLARANRTIRSLTITPADEAFEILCADVTRPADLPKLEAVLERSVRDAQEVRQAAERIALARPAGQTASIRRQLGELYDALMGQKWDFDPEKPVAIGVSGGRFRIAFMHPDMGRFYGPAWQVPIGASNESGTEQITLLMQETDDGRLHLHPLAERFRESVDFIAADREEMYPDRDVTDWYRYEEFGTNMSRRILLSLGYFSDEELSRRTAAGLPLPPESLWAGNNMRRPFSLVSNAIASLRTYRAGEAGKRIDERIGRGRFGGLNLTSTGLMPQGGFSCSSALTIAVKNALNALFDFSLSGDELIHLAAQAEYGTGVRAGALDQATVQKGKAGEGTLISSNPRDQYAVLGTYPTAKHIAVLFPYTAARDSGSVAFSAGFYAAGSETGPETGVLTTTETRKLTGKAAEIAAILLRQPLDIDLFDEIRDDLLDDGLLSESNRRKIADKLLRLPLCVAKKELFRQVEGQLDFYAAEQVRCFGMKPDDAAQKARSTAENLFLGWRNPLYRAPNGERRAGVPLRAMVAYLYAEVAKNFYLIHHPNEWTTCVTNSQRGDRCFEIDPKRLPSRTELETTLDFERDTTGADRVALWLDRLGAAPFDFNAGIDDITLALKPAPVFHSLLGGNFFRGLALIDLVEAFLLRAFDGAVAVRVNAAGQGDFFQVHIDTSRCTVAEVKAFLDRAYYRRFGIVTDTPFIEVNPGGGAVGVKLSRLSLLKRLIAALR